MSEKIKGFENVESFTNEQIAIICSRVVKLSIENEKLKKDTPLPKWLSSEAYDKAKSCSYEQFVTWWDKQK